MVKLSCDEATAFSKLTIGIDQKPFLLYSRTTRNDNNINLTEDTYENKVAFAAKCVNWVT